MTIEKGILPFSAAESFRPGLTESEFRTGLVGGQAPVLTAHQDFVSYKIGKIIYAGRNFCAVAQFERGALIWVSLSRPADPGESWSTYDQAKEEAWVEATKAWLSLILNHSLPADFAWGTLDCRFDPRGGLGAVIISYRHLRSV